MAHYEPADSILHEVRDHAGTQAAPPVGQQAKQSTVHGDDQHEFPSLISVTRAERNALEHDAAHRGVGQCGKLSVQISTKNYLFAEAGSK